MAEVRAHPLRSILALLLGMAVAGMVWFGTSRASEPHPPDLVSLRFAIERSLPDDDPAKQDGDSCLFDTRPWNQVVLTDADDHVVGAFWPEVGILTIDEEGAASCLVYAEFSVPDSPFYIMYVNGQYRQVFEQADLLSGALVEPIVTWKDAPPVDFGTPEPAATPEVTS